MMALDARGVAIKGRLHPTDFAAEPGLIALVGPNGGGKTSLLRALADVEDAVGDVTIDGESLARMSEARRRSLLALMPASRDLGWPIAVRDVIALGLGRPDAARITALLDAFELGPLADRPVNALSTGERSRVLVARALAARPRLLLLDEPFANLEPYWVLRLHELLRDAAEAGCVVIVALHDLALLDRFDRALVVVSGKIALDDRPAALTASERFGSIFRVSREEFGWSIRTADRQSSP